MPADVSVWTYYLNAVLRGAVKTARRQRSYHLATFQRSGGRGKDKTIHPVE